MSQRKPETFVDTDAHTECSAYSAHWIKWFEWYNKRRRLNSWLLVHLFLNHLILESVANWTICRRVQVIIITYFKRLNMIWMRARIWCLTYCRTHKNEQSNVHWATYKVNWSALELRTNSSSLYHIPSERNEREIYKLKTWIRYTLILRSKSKSKPRWQCSATTKRAAAFNSNCKIVLVFRSEIIRMWVFSVLCEAATATKRIVRLKNTRATLLKRYRVENYDFYGEIVTFLRLMWEMFASVWASTNKTCRVETTTKTKD